MTEENITEDEARAILAKLARHGPASAQVAAIRVLRLMDKEAAEAEEAAKATPPGFEGLYSVGGKNDEAKGSEGQP
jgi:hypothetical protein